MKFSDRSQARLDTCHPDLITVFEEAIKTSLVDFGISEGQRSAETQLKYFLDGKSRIDPRIPELKKKGKHLRTPSEAVDIYAFVPGRKDLSFDKIHLAYLGGHIMGIADRLYREGAIRNKLRWGGNWDSDGELFYDQSLKDMPHFELI